MPLAVIPTPVGNLGDMSARALETLAEADIIACEDTRVSGPLLRHFGISAPLISYYAHNERQRTEQLLSMLQEGKKVALISDAGTPGISDPGAEIIRRCIDEGIGVTVLPGPTDFVPALVMSGLKAHPFLFYGFLPDRAGEREKVLTDLASLDCTLVFYVSPHKAERHIRHSASLLGNRKAALVREISKIYEEARRGTLEELARSVAEGVRGELVLVVEGASPQKAEEGEWKKAALEMIEAGVSSREVVKILSKEYGLSKNEIKSFLFAPEA
ncbi:MAG: 16S rRNA (cytidine(1402)-2'-O)-methyltransferase [Aminivibrio sp.]